MKKRTQLDTTTKKILLLLVIMAVFTILMAAVRPKFISASNMLNILKDIAVMGTLAMGMTFVLITGGIDLSAGYNVTLGMVVAGGSIYEHLKCVAFDTGRCGYDIDDWYCEWSDHYKNEDHAFHRDTGDHVSGPGADSVSWIRKIVKAG